MKGLKGFGDMVYVVKIGGSVLLRDIDVMKNLFGNWAREIARVVEDFGKLVVVVGGGVIARRYIAAAPDEASSFDKDFLGILVTRANATLLALHLRKQGLRTPLQIPENPIAVKDILELYDVVVVGGYIPGESTTGVSAITAEAVNAKGLFIATDVPGVFDKNPKQFKDAKKYDTIRASELISMFSTAKSEAGTYHLLDMVSLKILERSRMPAVIFDGSNPENLYKVVRAFVEDNLEELKKFGTLIL